MAIATFASGFILDKLLEKGESILVEKGIDKAYGLVGKAINKKTLNPFQIELNTVIIKSLEDYKKKFSISVALEKIHFTDSQTFWELLTNNIIGVDTKPLQIIEELKKDSRIIVPEESDVISFIEIYNVNIASNPSLEKLNISENYKIEIFKISKKVSEISIQNQKFYDDNIIIDSLKESIKNRDAKITDILIDEVELIKADIENLKIESAKLKIENFLSKYETSTNYLTAKTLGELYLLLAKCNELLYNETFQNYLNAKKYLPENSDIQAQLGFHFLYQKQTEQSREIYQNILKLDEFNPLANSLKIIIEKDGDYREVNENINSDVRKDLRFKFPIFMWNLNKHHPDIINIANNIGMNEYEDRELIEINLSSKNFTFWVVFSQYLIHKYFLICKDNESLGLADSILYDKITGILNKIIDLLENSELKKYYSQFYFQYNYFKWNKNKESTLIGEIESCFKKLDFSLLTPGYFMQMLEVISWEKNPQSLERMESYLINAVELNKHKLEIKLLLIRCLIIQNKWKDVNEKILEVINNNNLDEFILLNLFVLFEDLLRKHYLLEEDTLHKIDVINFSNNHYNYILNIFCKTNFKKTKIEEENVTKLVEIYSSSNGVLKVEILKILYLNEYYQDCISIIKKEGTDLTIISEELLIYCDSLYRVPDSSQELVNIFNTLRKNNKYNQRLIDIETEFYYSLRRWDIVNEVTTFGLGHNHKNRNFLYCKVIALQNLNLENELEKLLDTIDPFDYDNDFASNIAKAYFKIKVYKKALEISYELVQKSKLYEELFINIFLNIPEGLSPQEKTVVESSFVTCEIQGEEYEFKCEKDNQFTNTLIGKKVGDEFEFIESLTEKKRTGVILAIYEKYGNLFQKIFKNAGNPASALKLKKINFNGDDIDSINAALIENLGEVQEERLKNQESLFEDYYQAELSFSELLNQTLVPSFFDLYFYLTNNINSKFISIPYVIFKDIIKKTNHYLLDFTSIPLFFILEEKGLFRAEIKFKISSFTKSVINDFLDNEKQSIKSEIVLSITSEKVVPTFYSKEFYEARSILVSKFSNWIEQNTEVVNSSSFHNYLDIFKNDKNGKSDYFKAIVDNALMAREQYLLFTNDTIYVKHNLGFPADICNPLNYIKQEANNFENICEFLIKQNYLGIEITTNILIREYDNLINNLPNHFEGCVANLNIELNPNLHSTYEAILFMFHILTQEKYNRNDSLTICENIFITLMKYNNQAFLDLVSLNIFKIFYMDEANQKSLYEIIEKILLKQQ